jgi:uncharacterized protein (TIGR02284 family)
METTEKVHVLNDLIEINNDRVAGFEKAMTNIEDANVDLKELFQRFSQQSRRFSQELSAIVANHGGDVETGTSASGSMHRAWIDVKSLFGDNDREAILNEAERGEDAIKKAYRDALADTDLPVDSRDIVARQSADINAAHDEIKALRDAASGS